MNFRWLYLLLMILMLSILLYQNNKISELNNKLNQFSSPPEKSLLNTTKKNQKEILDVKNQRSSNNHIKSLPEIESQESFFDKQLKDLALLRLEKIKSEVTSKYDTLFNELNLSEEDKRKLHELLVELGILFTDYPKTSNEIDAKNQQIKTLLGNSEDYNLYVRFREVGSNVSRLSQKLDRKSTIDLEPEQKHQLGLFYVKNYPYAEKLIFSNEHLAFLESMSIDDRAEYLAKEEIALNLEYEEFLNNQLEHARGFLLPEQLEVLEKEILKNKKPLIKQDYTTLKQDIRKQVLARNKAK